jgi:hypothetical protein
VKPLRCALAPDTILPTSYLALKPIFR